MINNPIAKSIIGPLQMTLWITLLSFPLAGFIIPHGAESWAEVDWTWGKLSQIAIITFVISILFEIGKRYKEAQQAKTERRVNAGETIQVKEDPINAFVHHPMIQKWGGKFVLLFALLLPFLGMVEIGDGTLIDSFDIDVMTKALIFVMIGLGLNIVVGLAGLLDLGYVAFFGVGAYFYALMYQYFGWTFWMALPLAGFVSALFGVVLGFPVLRLRGDYLAIVTLGFGEIIRLLLNNLDWFTNGPNGIHRIPKPTLFNLGFMRRSDPSFYETFGLDYDKLYRGMFLYFLILILTIITVILVRRLNDSRIGLAWLALREDEIACGAMGIDTTLTKLTAFGLGAAWAGFAGAFFAGKMGSVSPESFTFFESAIILAIVVLGGMGSIVGVISAALILMLLPEYLRDLEHFRMLIFGGLMVYMMNVRPGGLISHINVEYDMTKIFAKRKKSKIALDKK